MVKYSPSICRENILMQKRCGCLLVLVVAVGGVDEDNDFGVVDFVDKAVLLCDVATPLVATIAAQLLGVAGAGAGMQSQLGKEFHYFLETVGFAPFQLDEVCLSPVGVSDFVHATTSLAKHSSLRRLRKHGTFLRRIPDVLHRHGRRIPPWSSAWGRRLSPWPGA